MDAVWAYQSWEQSEKLFEQLNLEHVVISGHTAAQKLPLTRIMCTFSRLSVTPNVIL